MSEIALMSDNDLLCEIVDLTIEIQNDVLWLQKTSEREFITEHVENMIADKRRAIPEKSTRLSVLRTEALSRMSQAG